MYSPRERLAALGPTLLSDAELLAVILGTGGAGEDAVVLGVRLLREAGSLWALRRKGVFELTRFAGVGPAKASRLAAAFEAGVRALTFPNDDAHPLTHSQAVFRRYGPALMTSVVERFVVVSVDAKNRPRAHRTVALGGRTACQVDPTEVFRFLVAESASGAIFLHNHPSGDPAPSDEDLELNERLSAAASLLDIRALDHLIVGQGRYTSLRDAGLWPTTATKSGPSTCSPP